MQLELVDDCGGSLAAIGVALARARGLDAVARVAGGATIEPEVAQVLAEIDVAAVADLGVPSGGAKRETEVVTIGADEGATIVASLYRGPAQTSFGPATLERLALARIARDRIERWLDGRVGG